MSDAQRIKELLRGRVGELASYLFPNGHREGNHWRVGSIEGEPGKSFDICIAGSKAGLWGDFNGAAKHSANLLNLWMVARNVDFKTALSEAGEWLGQHLNGATRSESKTRSARTFSTLEEAIAFAERKLKASATRRDTYHDRRGNEHFVVVRFDGEKGKQFRPFHQNGSGWVIEDPPGKLPLFRLPELISRPNELVFLVEGEKCVCDLETLGLLVTTSAHGANSANKTDWEPLAGREVVILPDNDGGGRDYAQTIVDILNRLSPPALVKIVELPGLPPKGDCVDWLDARDAQTPEDIIAELLALVENAKVLCEIPSVAPTEPDVATRLNSSKPKVELPCDGRLLSQFAKEIGGHLKTCGLYERGGMAFIVNEQKNALEVVTPQMLRTLVENHLVCYRIRPSGGSEISLDRTMSEGDAKGVLCAQQFLSCLPKLEKIATTRLPVMRATGKIELLPAGYDPQSLTLTTAQCEYVETLPLPQARKRIDDLLYEFCFADKKRSKAVTVAAMLTPYGSGLLSKEALRPAFIYLANAEGAGKTMLAKCAISPVHGLVDTEGAPKDKAEIAKELLTAVIEARSYTLLDNCKGHLDSAPLEAFLTSVRWKGRILGVSKSFCGEKHVTVFITGNGCTVSPDIRRRSLFVELFMEQELAEDRKFDRILDDGALLAMRADILAALWTLVREWDAAGRPKPTRTHSSFPRWAEIVGGIVEFAGFGCPLETAEIQSASDVDGSDMRELVKLLAKNDEAIKFDELVATAREHGLFERLIGSDGELKPSEKSALGKLFKRYDRRIFAGCMRFVVEGKGHTRSFRVISDDAK
jgi:hypothetical protein